MPELNSTEKKPPGLWWPQEEKMISPEDISKEPIDVPKVLKHLDPRLATKVSKAQDERTEALADFDIKQKAYDAKLDYLTDKVIAGEITSEELKEQMESDFDWGDLGSAVWESAKRVATFKEAPLDPLRKEFGKQDTRYVDPMAIPQVAVKAALSKNVPEALGTIVKGTLGKGTSSKYGYQEKIFQDQPRRAAIENLKKPLYDENGLLDYDAVLSSNMSRADANDAIVADMAYRYNIPHKLLRGLLLGRGAFRGNDSFTTTSVKALGQVIDGLLFRIPSMVATVALKGSLKKELKKALTRPAGMEFFDKETVEKQINPQMKAIANGKIDELTVNGMEIDVNPDDNIETIQDKAYAKYIKSIFAQAENLGTSPGADIAGMFIPLAQGTKLAKAISKGFNTAEDLAKVSKIMKYTPTNTTLIFNPLVNKLPSKVVKTLQNSRIARVGDWTLTTVGVPAAGAAIGAPAGTELEEAVGTGAFAGSISGTLGVSTIGISKAHALTVKGIAHLTDRNLIKAIKKKDSFKGMNRILQKKMKDRFGEHAEEAFNAMKGVQKLNDFVAKNISDEAKARLKNVDPNSIEFLRALAHEPEFVNIVDAFEKQATFGKSLTAKGKVAQAALLKHISMLNAEKSTVNADIADNNITASAGQQQKNLIDSRIAFLKDIVHDKRGLLEDWDGLFNYMEAKDHPLSKQLRNQIQAEDIAEVVVDDLQYLIQGKIAENMTVDEYTTMLNNGVIPPRSGHDTLLLKLIQQQAKDTEKGKDSVNVEATLIKIMEDPEAALADINKITELADTIQELSKMQNLDLPKLRKAKKALRTEIVKHSEKAKDKRYSINKAKQVLTNVRKMVGLVSDELGHRHSELDYKSASSSMKRGTLIPKHVLDRVDNALNRIDDTNPDFDNLVNLKEFMEDYNSEIRNLKKRQIELDNIVDDHFNLVDDLEASPEDLPKFMAEEFANLIGTDIEVAKGSLDRYVREINNRFHKNLNKSEDFNYVQQQIHNSLAYGTPIPDSAMHSLNNYINDAKALDTLLKDSFGDAAKLINKQDAIQYLKEVRDFYTKTEDVYVRAKSLMDQLDAAISEEEANVTLLTSMVSELKDKYKYTALRRQIKAMDERVYKYFEKAIKGSNLSRAERKRIYNFLAGSVTQRVSKLLQPDWIITNRAYAENYFNALKAHSASSMAHIAERYNDTFGTQMDTISFASLFVNAQQVFNLDDNVRMLTEIARLRRGKDAEWTYLMSLGLNQETMVQLLEDRSLMAMSGAVEGFAYDKQQARTVGTNFLIDNLFNPLNAIGTKHGYNFMDRIGKKTFIQKFQRFMGVDGFRFWTHLTSQEGVSHITEYGKILYEWKVERSGKDLDGAMSYITQDANWKDNAKYSDMYDNLKQYWGESATDSNTPAMKAEYELLFDAMRIIQEMDYKKVQEVNRVVRDNNVRNGTTFAEFNFMPHRLMMVRARSLKDTFANASDITRTSFDTVFGRHISSSKEGQINKIREVPIDTAANPWEVIVADSLHMFEHVYTNYNRKRIGNTAIRMNNLGYYAEGAALLRSMGVEQSNAQTAVMSLPNNMLNVLYNVPGFGTGALLIRGLFGSKLILSRPSSILFNMVNGAGTAAWNPKDLGASVRIFFKYPLLTMQRVFMASDKVAEVFPGYTSQHTLTPELRGDEVGLEAIMPTITLRMGETSGIGRRIVEEALFREQNAANQAKFNLYASSHRLSDWKYLKRAAMLVNTVSDILSDASAKYLKESMELSQSKASLTDGMLVWEKAIQMAQRSKDVESLTRHLIANMRGLRNQAPFFQLASQLIRNIETDPYRGALEYITMYKNHQLGRFDPSNVPAAVKQQAMMIPGASQFYNAMSNHIYRLAHLSRRLGGGTTDEGHKHLVVTVLASMVLQGIATAWMKDGFSSEHSDEGSLWDNGIGINGERASSVSIITSTVQALIGKDPIKIAKFMDAKLTIGGLEYRNYVNMAYKLTKAAWIYGNEDDPYSKIKFDLALAAAVDQAYKMSPLVLMSDFFTSPAQFGYQMLMDPHDAFMKEAVLRAESAGYDSQMFYKLGKLYRDTTGHQDSYDFWNNMNAMTNYAGILGYSNAASQILEFNKRMYAKEAAFEKLERDAKAMGVDQLPYNELVLLYRMAQMKRMHDVGGVTLED